MLRSLVSTARRQRTVAALSVVTLAIAVPPAVGAPSVPAQVKSALKLAKRADKNATAALKLAKTSGAGTDGTAGTSGDRGPAGPAGPAGAKGDTGAPGAAGAPGAKGDAGAAGPQGPKGDTGATGAKGETGATGPQGPAGPAAPAGGGSTVYADAAVDTTPDDPFDFGLDSAFKEFAVVDVPAGGYLVSGHLKVSYDSNDSISCELRSGSDVIDAAKARVLEGGADVSFNAATQVAAPGSIAIHCKGANTNALNVDRANLTALSVSSIVTPAGTTPTP